MMAVSAAGMAWHSLDLISLHQYGASLSLHHLTESFAQSFLDSSHPSPPISSSLPSSPSAVNSTDPPTFVDPSASAAGDLSHSLAPTSLALYGAVASIVVKELLYRVTALVGHRHHSSAVIANAAHHRRSCKSTDTIHTSQNLNFLSLSHMVFTLSYSRHPSTWYSLSHIVFTLPHGIHSLI